MATHRTRKINLNTAAKAGKSHRNLFSKDFERIWRNIEARLDKQEENLKRKKLSAN